MVWDHFHKTFFFRRINCLKAGRNTHSFLAFLFLQLNSGPLTTQPTPFPSSWDSSRRAVKGEKENKKNIYSRDQDTRHMGLNKGDKFRVRTSSFRIESSTIIILFCFQCWASQSSEGGASAVERCWVHSQVLTAGICERS